MSSCRTINSIPAVSVGHVQAELEREMIPSYMGFISLIVRSSATEPYVELTQETAKMQVFCAPE